MASYEITSPDGQKFQVTAPDDATPDQVMEYAKSNFAQPKTSISATTKIAKGLTDPIEGAAQLLTNILPSGVVNAGNRLNNLLAEKTGLVAPIPQGGMNELVKQNEQAYQAQRQGAGESGFDAYRTIGNVLSPANAVLAAKLPQAATLATKLGFSALGGGVSALSNPVTSGEFWPEKSAQVGYGALGGAAVAPAVSALGRVISPNASVNPQLEMLRREGVNPTIGQTLGGFANKMEEKLQSLPIMGDAIAAAREKARSQFNTAAINRSTGKIGEDVEGAGHAAIKEAGDKIGAVYDKARSMLGNFQVDKQAQSELANLRMMTQQLRPSERKEFENLFKSYQKELTPNGHLMADGFERITSKLTKEEARFSGASDAYQQRLGDALKEMKSIIESSAKRANPKAAELYDSADAAWANLVRLEGAAKAAKGGEGVFTPGQLLTAIQQADKSTRGRSVARGTALMQDLATAGQSVLGNKVPDSGTAGRLAMGMGGLGAGAISPAIPLSLLGGAAAYSPPVQSALRAMVANRPQFAQPIAESLQKVSPFLVPAGAQVGLGLLN
jgi:hypothetical protein